MKYIVYQNRPSTKNPLTTDSTEDTNLGNDGKIRSTDCEIYEVKILVIKTSELQKTGQLG